MTKIYGKYDVEFQITPEGEFTTVKLIVGPFATEQGINDLFDAAGAVLRRDGKNSIRSQIDRRMLAPKLLDGDASMTGRELIERAIHRYLEQDHHLASIRQWIGLDECPLN